MQARRDCLTPTAQILACSLLQYLPSTGTTQSSLLCTNSTLNLFSQSSDLNLTLTLFTPQACPAAVVSAPDTMQAVAVASPSLARCTLRPTSATLRPSTACIR